ncbi:hypothetical protein MBLNU457_6617t1 [Dothideomycetes sp. NU457]
MPSSDYTTTGGGLKLKGAKNAGIDKKRKKKSKSTTGSTTVATTDASGARASKDDGANDMQNALAQEDADLAHGKDVAEQQEVRTTKTEAERRHEELRRKRLDERLKKEGVKTHKERVEELNTYLSKLSEHHDMPRIGPG